MQKPADATERHRRDESAHIYDAALHWDVNEIPTESNRRHRVLPKSSLKTEF